MALNPQQLSYLKEYLLSKGLYYEPVENELIDEAACLIEAEMKKGISFDQASKLILSQIGTKDIIGIQNQISKGIISTGNYRKFWIKRASFLSILLIVWVLGEHLIGEMIGRTELGPVYGTISMIIIFFWIHKSLIQANKSYFDNCASFKSLFITGFFLTLVASGFLCVLVSIVWIYLYPDYFHSFQIDEVLPEISKTRLLMGSIVGTGIATTLLGIISTFISAWYHRLKT